MHKFFPLLSFIKASEKEKFASFFLDDVTDMETNWKKTKVIRYAKKQQPVAAAIATAETEYWIHFKSAVVAFYRNLYDFGERRPAFSLLFTDHFSLV